MEEYIIEITHPNGEKIITRKLTLDQLQRGLFASMENCIKCGGKAILTDKRCEGCVEGIAVIKCDSCPNESTEHSQNGEDAIRRWNLDNRPEENTSNKSDTEK